MTHAMPSLARLFVATEAFLRAGTHASSSFTPLIRLVVEDNVDELRTTLEEDASEIDKRHFGCTPLGVAAAFGRVECLDLLLEFGASSDPAPGSGSWRPICLACIKAHAACVRRLLAAGAAAGLVDDDDGAEYTPLQCAAEVDAVECVEALLAAGAATLEPLDRGHWALLSACQHGSVRSIALLLAATPAAVNLPTPEDDDGEDGGATPLMQACLFRQAAVVRLLLDGGAMASLGMADALGQDAMWLACDEPGPGSLECVQELVAAGGDLNESWTRQRALPPERRLAWLDTARALGPWSDSWLSALPLELARRALRMPHDRRDEDGYTRVLGVDLHEPRYFGERRSNGFHEPRRPRAPIILSHCQANTRSALDVATEFARDHPGDDGRSARLVIAAAQPWSPATHELFPHAARRRAVDVLKLIYLLCAPSGGHHRGWAHMTPWFWVHALLPHVVTRDAASHVV